MQRGSFELMKKLNQQVILKIIHNNSPISRARIAEVTGLSPATVSNIVKELLEMELVRETSRGESRGGRKPVLLELNPSGAYLIGLEWGIAEIKAVLMDLSKRVKAVRDMPVDTYQVGDFIDSTLEIIDIFSHKVDHPERIYGVGIGVHGLVNPEKGVSLFAPHFKWEDVPIKEYLRKRMGYPVLLDNDVRMMALAEKWDGKDNFIFINTGPGIGAAIVLDGRLHFGRDFSAGEFGHMTIVKEGPLCSCGNFGCLEALISVDRLVREFNPDLHQGLSYGGLKEEWGRLIMTAKKGQNKAREILTDAARYLGTGIANLVNLLNPESIIIGGDFIEAEKIIFPLIKEQVSKKALSVPSRKLKIMPTVFGENAGAVGAATMVLQKIFKLEERDNNE